MVTPSGTSTVLTRTRYFFSIWERSKLSQGMKDSTSSFDLPFVAFSMSACCASLEAGKYIQRSFSPITRRLFVLRALDSVSTISFL